MLGVYTIVAQAATVGWGAPRTLILAAASVALLVAFVLRQATAPNPLMPLSVLRSRETCTANLVQALLTTGMFGMFFLASLYLQRVRGFDALHIGLAFLPLTVVVAIVSMRYSDRLVLWHGPVRALLSGLGLVAAGLFALTRCPVHGHYLLDLLLALLVLGVGVGLAFPAVMALAMSQATEVDAGLTSGLINTTVQVSGALGLGLLATLASSETHRLLHTGSPALSALNAGYHLGFAIGGVLVVVAAVVLATVLGRPQPDAKPSPRPPGQTPFTPTQPDGTRDS